MSSLKVGKLTTTRGFHYNVKVNAHRSRSPTAPAICLTTGHRSKGFRRNKADSRRSGASGDTPKDDRRKWQRHDGSRSESVERNRLRAGNIDNAAIFRGG